MNSRSSRSRRGRREPSARPTAHQTARSPSSVRGWVERKRKVSRFYFIAALTLVLAGAFYVEWNQRQNKAVWGTELYLLKEVEVNGVERFSKDEIVEIAGLEIGKTTMDDVDRNALTAALTNSFSDIEPASIRVDVPTGLVSISLDERKPTAWFQTRGKVYCIDDDQVVLDRPFRLELLRDVPLKRLAKEGLVELAVDSVELGADGRPILDDALRMGLQVAIMDQVIHEKRQEEGYDDSSFRARSVDARDPRRIAISYAPNGSRMLRALLVESDYSTSLRSIRVVESHRAAKHQNSLSSSGNILDGAAVVEEIDARFSEDIPIYALP